MFTSRVFLAVSYHPSLTSHMHISTKNVFDFSFALGNSIEPQSCVIDLQSEEKPIELLGFYKVLIC